MFNQYAISEKIIKALDNMGYKEPTKVQAETIDKILNDKDLIVNAKTGSGKTAAFGVPIIEKIDNGKRLPQALIMTPTRELAIQVSQELTEIGKLEKTICYTVYGQHNIETEIKQLQKGIDIIVGTPGRLLDHLERESFNPSEIKYVVLDEADRMLDMGFIDQVSAILKQMPKERYTYLFSATMPFEVRTIAWEYMNEPETIEISSDTKTVDIIKQEYVKLERHEKRIYLDRFLALNKPQACIVFCNTRRCVDMVLQFLQENDYKADALHGAISQSKRTKTIEAFKKGRFNVLVATDVAARGIHVDNLDLVINYDVPIDYDNYVHRVGRTGRAGNDGMAISFVTSEDLMTLYEIEEHIGVMIPERELPSYSEAHHKKKTKKAKKADKAKSLPSFAEETVVKTKVVKGSPKPKTVKKAVKPTVKDAEQHAENKISATKTAEIINNYKNKSKKQSFWQKLKAKIFG